MKNKPFPKLIIFSFLLVSIIFFSTLSKSKVVSIAPTDVFDTDFDAQVGVLMNIAKVESLALSIINGTDEFYATAYGEQPDTEIIYYINDISGCIATTALLQLMDDGLFDIDDPVNDFLPWILRNPYYPSINITIHDILSHQAGIDSSTEFYEAYKDKLYPFSDLLYEVFNENGSYYTADTWRNDVPGTTYRSQWINYDFTAYLVELISGVPFEQYVTNNIFTPLGMINTEFTYTNYTLVQLAKQYLWNSTSGINEELSFRDTYVHTPGSGGVLSTVSDLSRFLIAHMNDGVYDSVRILEGSTVNLMHADLGFGRGLGWDNDVQNGFQGLMGSIFGDTFMLTKADIGVIVFTNQCLFLEGFAGKIRDIIDYITDVALELIPEPITTTTTSTSTTTSETAILYFLPLGLMIICIVLFRRKRN